MKKAKVVSEHEQWHRENLMKVATAIEELGGRHLDMIAGPKHGGRLDFYSVNGRVLILQEFANADGLEVFRLLCPASDSMKIDDLIESIARYAEGEKVGA